MATDDLTALPLHQVHLCHPALDAGMSHADYPALLRFSLRRGFTGTVAGHHKQDFTQGAAQRHKTQGLIFLQLFDHFVGGGTLKTEHLVCFDERPNSTCH